MGKSFNLNRILIKRTLDRYAEAKGVQDRAQQGRPRSQRTQKLIKGVREKICRNPRKFVGFEETIGESRGRN